MSPAEALNRLTRSKRDEKLADEVRKELKWLEDEMSSNHYSLEIYADKIHKANDSHLELVARLEEIADMPNGKAKNQLRRLLRELNGEPVFPGDEDVSIPDILPDGTAVYPYSA